MQYITLTNNKDNLMNSIFKKTLSLLPEFPSELPR